MLVAIFKLLAIVAGFIFPAFLLQAIAPKGHPFCAPVCTLSFGFIVLVIMLLLPN